MMLCIRARHDQKSNGGVGAFPSSSEASAVDVIVTALDIIFRQIAAEDDEDFPQIRN